MGIEKYLSLVLLVAPGFISTYIASVLGTAEPKRSEFSLVMRYFLHSFFAIVGAMVLLWGFGYISLDNTWQEIVQQHTTVKFTMIFFVTMLIASIFTGFVWSFFLHRKLLDCLNYFNRKHNRSIKFIDGSLLHRMFASDEKEHFVIVYKEGVDEPIAIGFYFASSDPDNDRIEMDVTAYPEYRQEYARSLLSGDSPLCDTIHTYMDFTNGIIVVETRYLPEWLS